jgi:hypothetical protein
LALGSGQVAAGGCELTPQIRTDKTKLVEGRGCGFPWQLRRRTHRRGRWIGRGRPIDRAWLRLRQVLALLLYVSTLLLALLGVLGVLFWPVWSADARERRLGVMTALAG